MRGIWSRAIMGAAVVAVAACTPTRYAVQANGNAGQQVRFDGPTEGEKIVRHAKETRKEHYFLLGLIAKDDTVDVRQELRLAGGEKAVNFSVKNEQDFVDTLAQLGGIILTAGLVSPLIWQMRSTTVEADVVAPEKQP